MWHHLISGPLSTGIHKSIFLCYNKILYFSFLFPFPHNFPSRPKQKNNIPHVSIKIKPHEFDTKNDKLLTQISELEIPYPKGYWIHIRVQLGHSHYLQIMYHLLLVCQLWYAHALPYNCRSIISHQMIVINLQIDLHQNDVPCHHQTIISQFSVWKM